MEKHENTNFLFVCWEKGKKREKKIKKKKKKKVIQLPTYVAMLSTKKTKFTLKKKKEKPTSTKAKLLNQAKPK